MNILMKYDFLLIMTQNDYFYVIISRKYNTSILISPISGENKGLNHDHSEI